MKYIAKIFYLSAFMALILLSSACGKISDPVPIEGSGYPHSYPRR